MPHDGLVLDSAFRGVFSSGFVVSPVLLLFLFRVVNYPFPGTVESAACSGRVPSFCPQPAPVPRHAAV